MVGKAAFVHKGRLFRLIAGAFPTLPGAATPHQPRAEAFMPGGQPCIRARPASGKRPGRKSRDAREQEASGPEPGPHLI